MELNVPKVYLASEIMMLTEYARSNVLSKIELGSILLDEYQQTKNFRTWKTAVKYFLQSVIGLSSDQYSKVWLCLQKCVDEKEKHHLKCDESGICVDLFNRIKKINSNTKEMEFISILCQSGFFTSD